MPLLTAEEPVAPATTEQVPAPEALAPDDWRADLAPELRDHPSLKSYKDKGAAVKSLIEAQKMVGGAVKVPAPDAAPEEWDKFYAKVGRPEAPDKYTLEIPDQVKPLFDEETDKEFRAQAHRMGLTPKQANDLLKWYGVTQIETAQAKIAAGQKETEAALREEWGARFDTNLALAQRAVRDMGGADVLSLMNATGIGNHPAMIKMMAKVGAALAEEGVIVGEVAGVAGVEDAKTKIASIMNDKSHAYHKANAAGHAEAVAEMQRLYQVAYPSLV